MENYNKLFVQLQGIIEGVIPKATLIYNKQLFIEEWINNPSLNWEEYLKELLEKVIEAQKTMIKFLEKIEAPIIEEHIDPFISNDEDDEFYFEESKEISIQNHKGEIVKFAKGSQDYEFFSKHLCTWKNLKEIQIILVDCLTFFKSEKEKPPFKTVLSKSERIPFFGNQAEFTGFISLLVKAGFIGAKDTNVLPTKEFAFLGDKKLKEISRLIQTKEKTTSILLDSFYFINIDKENKNYSVDYADPNTIKGKFNHDGIKRMGVITRQNLLEKFKKAVKILENLN